MTAAEAPHSIFTWVDGLRLHHLDWGGDGPFVVCLHGLTRSAHDFDPLARQLRGRFRVLCADARGRGESARAPADSYHFASYVRDLGGWLDALDLERVHLIGTSMGGITSLLFATAWPERVASLVLNDIGPHVEPAGLARIQQYVASAPEEFPTLEAVADWLAQTTPNPRLTRDDLLEWAHWQTRPRPGGGFGWHYDRAIRDQLRAPSAPAAAPPDLWAACEALRGPTLVVRGAESDVLSAACVAEMKARMQRCTSVEVAGIGHAPTLVESEVQDVLEAFLATAGDT